MIHDNGYIEPGEWASDNVTVDDLDWDEIIDAAESRLMETRETVTLSARSNIREVLSDLARDNLVQEVTEDLESEISGLNIDSADDISDTEPDGEYLGPHPDDDDLRCYINPWGVWRHVSKYDMWLDFTSEHEEPANAVLREITGD